MKLNLKTNRIVIAIVAVVAALVVAVVPAFAQAVDGTVTIPIADDAVLFHLPDGEVQIWAPNADDVWDPVIVFTADEVTAMSENLPTESTLITTSGDIAVYQSPDGEFYVSNGPDIEGKVRVAVFDSIFMYSHEYETNVYDS